MSNETGNSTIADPLGTDRTLAALDSPAPKGPQLILAFSSDDPRPQSRAELRPRGNVLGRGCTLFPGGPLADRKMSRSHGELRRRKNEWMLEDVGSRNGTRLNGEVIEAEEPTPLSDGDVIRMGGCIFVFRAEGGEGAGAAGGSGATVVGMSDAIATVHRAVAAVAQHRESVLITGETGTGKEVVARALHEASGRTGEFIAINCGAVSEGVLESELFGHKKGAFTGAVSDRLGLFRAADGGTLLLDEVGEMPPPLQVKLLRVLETRRVRPIGEQRDVAVDARVVAATNRDLVAEVRTGRFRADLYARLCQWPLHLPPLRDRREDIPLLVEALLERRGDRGKRLHARLAESLMLHPWPLNVRGLLNVLRVAVISNDDATLRMTEQVRSMMASDLALGEAAGHLLDADDTAPFASPVRGGVDQTEASVRRVAKPPTADELHAALTETEGSVSASARKLGCSRQQIYRVLEAQSWTLDQFRP